MSCAQLFVCFLALLFVCWLCICNCLLVLFFVMVLRIVLFIFVAKLFTFELLFLQVFLGATSSFLLSFWLRNLLLFVLQGMFACYVVLWCSFWVVSFLLLIFLLISCGSFLLILFGLNQFEFAGFGGFCVTIYIFLLLFCYRHIKLSRSPFFYRHSPRMILSDHLNHPGQLPVLFSPWHASKNKHNTIIFASFPVVFRSARVPAPQCIHKNPYASSHTHTNPYVSYHEKHDVRGNFPDHRAQIRVS